MALTKVTRGRIIMDLLKDGTVTSEANYASSLVDYIDAPTALKYVDAILRFHAQLPPETITAMSNEEKATAYLNLLRRWHQTALINNDVSDAVESTSTTSTSTAETDLGTEE